MSPDDGRSRPLADEPVLLASLADLDRGLADAETQVAPVPAAPPVSRSRPSPALGVPRVVAPSQRPLLDLFPVDPPRHTVASSPEVGGSALARALHPLEVFERSFPPVNPSSSPTYETFYGLRERPFGLSSDLKFLYHSAEHDRVTQQMLGAIGRREAIVTLTGELGVGKTMLCRALVEQLDRRTLTSFVEQPFTSAADLLKRLLVDFGVISGQDVSGLAVATTAELTTALHDFLTSLMTLQAFAVVIVDEAQNLSAERLEDIRAIADIEGETLLQVVLVGEPGLTALVARPALRRLTQRVALNARLGPLAHDEMADYIVHRLRMAGDHPLVEFNEAAVAKAYAVTGGLPRNVNLVCDRALEAGFLNAADSIDDSLVDSAAQDLGLASPLESRLRIVATLGLLILLVLAGAAAGAYVFRSDIAALVTAWENIPAPPGRPLKMPMPYRAPVPPDVVP